MDEYSGPVLVQGQAAAELFSRVFAPRLLAVRRPISDNPQLGMFFSQQSDTFVGRIGSRVLPAFLNVVDNPTLDQYHGVRLVGGYMVDEEGVRAHETRLVEKGTLKTLLASRDPVTGELRKRAYGPWVFRAFKILARLRRLRGTFLDVFGYTEERRTERRLIGEYEAILKEIAAALTPDNHPLAVEIARVPEQIRGFGHIKQRNLDKAKQREAALLEALRNPPAVAIAAE